MRRICLILLAVLLLSTLWSCSQTEQSAGTEAAADETTAPASAQTSPESAADETTAPASTQTSSESETEEEPVEKAVKPTDRTYYREKGGFGSDFTLRLSEDGSCFYYEGGFSSHLGFARWSEEDGIVTVSETRIVGITAPTEQVFCYRFRVIDGALVFIADRSDPFLYLQPEDGDLFILNLERPDFPASTGRLYLRRGALPANTVLLRLNENGSCYASKGMIGRSSGIWTEENGILTVIEEVHALNEDQKSLVSVTRRYRFTVTGDALIYLEQGSDDFFGMKDGEKLDYYSSSEGKES